MTDNYQRLRDLWEHWFVDDETKSQDPSFDEMIDNLWQHMDMMQTELMMLKEMGQARKMRERHRWEEVVGELRNILVIVEGNAKR